MADVATGEADKVHRGSVVEPFAFDRVEGFSDVKL
jgi:hypothetical protein